MKFERDMLILGGVGLALVLFYVYRKGVSGIASGAVNAAGEAATGTVLGVGDALGVPRTDQTACQQAIADGRTWDASFACDAGTFLKYLWGGSSSGQCTDCASKTTTPYDYGTGTAGVPYAPSATDSGYQMTDYANLGNLTF